MKTKKAISILVSQKEKIFQLGFEPIIWTDETLNYLEQIFGKDSEQYKQIHDFGFKDNYPKTTPHLKLYINKIHLKSEQDYVADYMESFINQLKNTGIPKNNNYPENKVCIDRNLFWTFLPIVIGCCFTLGLYFGNTKFDREKEDYYNAQKKWKESYDSLLIKYNKTVKRTDNNIK